MIFMSQVSERWLIPFFSFPFPSPSHPTFQMFPCLLFCLFCPSFTFVLCPFNSFSSSPLFFFWGGSVTVSLLCSFHYTHFSSFWHLGLLPCLLSSPITPTGPACLPAVGHGVSLPAAPLDLWRLHTSTRQVLAPKWWWSRGNNCPSQAHHRDLHTSYKDR